MESKDHFEKIYWFVVGLCLFAATLSIYVITIDRSHIAMVLTFWLSSGASGGIGYLIGSSMKTKQNAPGTATVDIQATTSSEPKTE